MRHIRDRHRPMGEHRGRGDKKWFGVTILIIGVFILLRKLDLFYFSWHSMWPWILIAIGAMIGAKNRFQNHAWWILILIGTAHLVPVFTIFGVTSKALLVPVAMIVLGLIFIFRPSKKKNWNGKSCDNNIRTVTNNDSTLNIDVTFGGHKEIVTSKDFKGGRVSTTFGGTELNLMNADSTETTIPLHFSVSFGGVELVVPSHWQVKNELTTTLGNVEDNRNIHTQSGDVEKVITLVLSGSCNFGNIEIKSY